MRTNVVGNQIIYNLKKNKGARVHFRFGTANTKSPKVRFRGSKCLPLIYILELKTFYLEA